MPAISCSHVHGKAIIHLPFKITRRLCKHGSFRISSLLLELAKTLASKVREFALGCNKPYIVWCVINAALPGAVSTRIWMQEKNSEGCPIINLVLMIPPKHEFIEERSWQLLTKFRSQKSLLFAYELVLLLRKNVSLQAGWWSCGIVLLLRQDTLPLTLFLALFLLPTVFWNKLLVAELKSDPL